MPPSANNVFGATDELQPHFAFSNYFGSGLYNTTGRDVTIFNIPLLFTPDLKEDSALYGTRIRVPVSVGFTNFRYEKVGETKLDQDTATLAIGLGLEKDIRESSKLKLVPFLDIGYANDFAAERGTLIYALGTSAYRSISFWDDTHMLFGKVQHAGFTRVKSQKANDFTSLQFGGDVKLPPRIRIAGRNSFISIYASTYFFMVGLDFEETDKIALQDEWVHEVGFTWGLTKAIKTSISDIERIGLGYRFSEKGQGLLHLSFNFPLD